MRKHEDSDVQRSGDEADERSRAAVTQSLKADVSSLFAEIRSAKANVASSAATVPLAATDPPRIRVCTDAETNETQQLGEDEVGDVLLAFATMPEGCVREQNCLSNTCSHLLPILRWYEGCSMTEVL